MKNILKSRKERYQPYDVKFEYTTGSDIQIIEDESLFEEYLIGSGTKKLIISRPSQNNLIFLELDPRLLPYTVEYKNELSIYSFLILKLIYIL